MSLSIQRLSSSKHTMILVVAAIAGIVASAQAAYSPPVSWSPMAMLNVSYSAATQRLDVVDQSVWKGTGPAIAVLAMDTNGDTTNLSMYARGNQAATTYGSFDPAQPWNVLNGTAFSRFLGWDDTNKNKTDGTALKDLIPATYGAGAGIWIECLSKSDGLESYLAVGKYGVNIVGGLDASFVPIIDPNANAYSGLFGTAGSSTQWKWDFMMDHNLYTVPSSVLTSPNQAFSATYKVYVGDAQGNEILNADLSSPSCEETWTWQGPSSVPEPATLTLLLAGGVAMWKRRR